MSAQLLKMVAGQPTHSAMGQLSDREFEVFQLISGGRSTAEIADELHLSAKTIDAHRANIKTKLGLKTTPELIAYAARWVESGGTR